MSSRPTARSWSGEEGIALVLAMFMVLVVSLLGASLATVGRTETLSSLNYRTMSQARYAAESGLHSAANYLIHTYQAPGVDVGDTLANYNFTVSPVTYNNPPVVLTTVAGEASNYPVVAKVNAFGNNASGPLQMANTTTTYSARARLRDISSVPSAAAANATFFDWIG
jgi:Tfp pilus assembly protein PilX